MPPAPSRSSRWYGPMSRGVRGSSRVSATSLLAQAELGHPDLEPAFGHFESFHHRVEITSDLREARLDLLPAEIGGLANFGAFLDFSVKRRPRDTELLGRRLRAPAMGPQRRQHLLLADLLGMAIRLPGGPPRLPRSRGTGVGDAVQGGLVRGGLRALPQGGLHLHPHPLLAGVAAREHELAHHVAELADVARPV